MPNYDNDFRSEPGCRVVLTLQLWSGTNSELYFPDILHQCNGHSPEADEVGVRGAVRPDELSILSLAFTQYKVHSNKLHSDCAASLEGAQLLQPPQTSTGASCLSHSILSIYLPDPCLGLPPASAKEASSTEAVQ